MISANDAEVLILSLVSGLEHNLTEAELPAQDRRTVAEEFVETIGSLVEAIGAPGVGKVAALLYMLGAVGADRLTDEKNKVVVTLIQSMQVIHARLQAARDGTEPPKPAPEPS